MDRLDVNLRGAAAGGRQAWTPFITGVDYDAPGPAPPDRLRQRREPPPTPMTRSPLRLTRVVTARSAADFPDDSAQPPGWPGRSGPGSGLYLRPGRERRPYPGRRASSGSSSPTSGVEPSAGYRYDAPLPADRGHRPRAPGPERPPDPALGGRRAAHPPAASRRRRGHGHLHRALQLRRGRQHPDHEARGARWPGWTCSYQYADDQPVPGRRPRPGEQTA